MMKINIFTKYNIELNAFVKKKIRLYLRSKTKILKNIKLIHRLCIFNFKVIKFVN